MGVAPPKHGFHASGQAHGAVVAQHLAEARVRAFDLVGCCGHLACPGGVQVREQQTLPDELVEGGCQSVCVRGLIYKYAVNLSG